MDEPYYGLCATGQTGPRCGRITVDGRRCMDPSHGSGPEYGPGRYTSTGERSIPLHTVKHRGVGFT